MVTPDQTGWRVGAVCHWLWTFVTPDTTVYANCPGRGFDDAATVLGTDYVGVLVRDGWAPSRSAGRRPAAARRRRAVRRAPGQRIPGRVPLLVGTPRSTPPTDAPNRPSGQPWSIRKVCGGNRYPPRRRHPAGPRQRRAHRPPTWPRPSSADRRDVACRRTRRPQDPPPSTAARVGRQRPNPCSKRDRSPDHRRDGERPDRVALRRHPTLTDRPPPMRSGALACGLSPPQRNAGGQPARRWATQREHTAGPSVLVEAPKPPRLKLTFPPVSIGKSPGNRIRWGQLRLTPQRRSVRAAQHAGLGEVTAGFLEHVSCQEAE